MERTGRKGRGTRRLFLALAVGVLLVAVLAGFLLRGRREGAAPEPGAAAAAVEEPRAGALGLVSAPAGDFGTVAEPAPLEESSAAGAQAAAGDEGVERVAAALGPRGRVVDATGAPVAGVVVERHFAGAIDHRASTGPDGVFAFGPEVNENGVLRAAKTGWRFTPASLRPRHVKAGLELVFQGERLIAAPVRGRVLDEATGEPVARYKLWFGQPGFDESQLASRSSFRVRRSHGPQLTGLELVTDEEGRFATPAPFEQGLVEVRLLECAEWRKLDHVVAQGVGEEHELGVRVGPTYFFDLEGHGELPVEALSVRLLKPMAPLARGDLARALETEWPLARELSSAGANASVHGLPFNDEARLRSDGDPAWVRLPPLDPHELLPPEPEGYRIQVSARGGRLAGLGRARSVDGVEAKRIPIRLAPFALLDGSLETGEGERVRGALVELRGGDPAQQPLACITGRSGGFDFHVPPGRYELAVESLRGSLRRMVELGPEVTKLALELPAVELMAVEGRVVARSGNLRNAPALELRALADPRLRFPANVDFVQQDGGAFATFRFDGVPAGSYELLAPPRAGFALEPRRLVVDRASSAIELACLDQVGATTLVFDFPDASGVRPRFWVEGEGISRWGGKSTVLATGTRVHWVVTAAGFLPAEGDVEAGPGAEQRVEVHLTPGSGAAVHATDAYGAAVEGADILLDGRLAGRTDEHGMALIAFGAPTSVLGARKPGWACASAELQADLGRGFVLFVRED